MDSILTRSFKCRFFPLAKDFLRRQCNPLGFQSGVRRSRINVVPLLRHGATAFRCKSSATLNADRTNFVAENEESDEFISDDLRMDNEDFVESDDETDFSGDDESSSSQDDSDDITSGSSIDGDPPIVNAGSIIKHLKAKEKALHFPWLNGVNVPDKMYKSPLPGPIKHLKTKKEMFFQFDYRNFKRIPITNPEMEDLLPKIEAMLKGIHFEQYSTSRGVQTLRKNIDTLPADAKVRKMLVGSGKRSVSKLGEGFDKAVYVTSHGSLRKAMFNLLYERHAIITSGWTFNLKKLRPEVLGQSMLGPETRVVMDHQLVRDVIGELWMRGISGKYNRLQKRHEERSAERNFLRYLKPKSKDEAFKMDWDTDLMINSNEENTRRTPSPDTKRWR